MSDPLWSASGAFVDYDRDGDLDLFVTNYLDFAVTGNKRCNDALGARDYCGPRAYRPVPDRLYRNEGGGRFTNVTEAAGISKADGAGLGVVDRRLQRRRVAGPLCRQRRDAEPALDQSAQRDVRGRGPAVGVGLERGRESRRQHGHRLRRFRPRRRRGPRRHEHRRRDFCRLRQRWPRQLRRCARPGGTVGTDGGVHRLWYRLVRLRQRRLARSLHRQRGGQHRRSATRGEVAVPDAKPVVSQHRRREVGGREQGRGRCLRIGRKSVAEQRLATSTTTAMSMSS